jgi:hypothetical protein
LARVHGAGEVLRSEPKGYGELIAPILTPLEQALKSEPKDLEQHAAGITLLDERLYAVGDDGRALRVQNVVRKTLTDAAAHWNADQTFVYRRKEQQFYVLKAETIQADGSIQPVEPDAIMMNSPQRQAQFALYDDLIEVRLIFPNVKPGSVTHVVVVTEDLKARMPGEFSGSFEWASTWPTGRIHFAADIAGPLAKRMVFQTIGTDVPPAVREELPSGHVRYSFERSGIAPLADENNSAPAAQVGPSIHFSTIPEWSDVGRWLAGLLKGRDVLTPALAAKVDDWTKGSTKPDVILGILFDKVANDVRYAGLELGESDYQPHECNAVWDNQYGDCKDKANLLVAFLKHKGLTAFVTFVNASDAGLIDRRVPDFHVFSHAIVALPDGRGGYKFCDPTIARGRPGLLGPADADRDVLVVTGTSSEWTHTPAQGAGQLAFHFDFELRPTGELAGWLEITADGFYGAAEDEEFRKLDRDESRRQVGLLARNFYPGAEIIDVAVTPRASPSERFLLRSYLTIPRKLEQGSGQQALMFPRTKDLFDFLGFTPARKTPFFINRGRLSVSAMVKLAPGLLPGEVPAPFDVDTPAGHLRSQWQVTRDACKMEMTVESDQSVLSPDDFNVYYGAVQSLEAWLDRPLSFTMTSSSAGLAPSEAPLQDLPRMPTGYGQLALVNNRFPEGGNSALRRAALEQTLQYFPGDKTTVFQASVDLASLDVAAGKAKEAVARLGVLLSAYHSEVSPEIYAWGQFAYAYALHAAGQDSAASQVGLAIAADASLPGAIRARCALFTAELLRKTAPDKALSALDGVLRVTSDVQPDLYAAMSYVLLHQGKAAEVRRRLREFVQAQPGALDPFFSRMVRDTSSWKEPGDDARQKEFFGLITEVFPKTDQGLEATMASARADRDGEDVYARIRATLAERFSKWPLAGQCPAADGTEKSDEDFDRAIRGAGTVEDLEGCIRLSVQALLSLPPGPSFPLRWSRAVAFSDWRERTAMGQGDDPVLAALLGVCDDMPHSQNAYWSGQLALAAHLERRGRLVDLQTRVSALLADPALPAQFRPQVLVRYARVLEKMGDYERALQTYASLEPIAASSPGEAGALLHAVFLYLHMDRPADAIRVIQILETVDSRVLDSADGAAQIREFIALRRAGMIPAFWSRRSKWWLKWEGISERPDIPHEEDETAVPVVASKAEWSAQIASAYRANDSAAFFKELRRAASAARWLPQASVDFAGFEEPISQAYPVMTYDLRKLLIVLMENEQDDLGDPAGLRSRQLSLAAFYLEDGSPASAMAVVDKFRKGPAMDDGVARAMNVVWGSAGLSMAQASPECINALEGDLLSPVPGGMTMNPAVFRARQVAVLAGLLSLSGRFPEIRDPPRRRVQGPAHRGQPGCPLHT